MKNPCCIYCGEELSSQNNMLIEIKSHSNIFQHWNTWLVKGCEKNIENKTPDYTGVIRTADDIQLIEVKIN